MKLFKSALPIFIVFQDDCIRYVTMKSQSPLVIHKIGETKLPAGIIQKGRILDKHALTKIVTSCVNNWKMKGKKVRFAIPDAISFIRKIPIPSTIPEKELDGYIQVELGATIHVPFDEPVFDLHKLKEEEEHIDYLLFAAPEAVMKDYMEVLNDAKLKPLDAELSSLAIYRLYYHLELVDPAKRYLLLNLERDGINGSAFYQHSPMFTRFISLNTIGQFSANEDHDFFDIDGRWNEVTTELGRIMNFYQFSLSDGAEFDAILVSGDHPQYEAFIEKVESEYDMKVIQIPEEKVKLERGLDVQREFFTTVGLGLRGSHRAG
ncbi:type IV pilus biogenesis protein PilM [Pseudalkalibacillus berkeleyi]|uniref:Pilus assembly protein PilM n=1 Tax=Pseudalkalibacillus berkeleyi TaxID=1069813 RepID=A0ABS9GZC5_9BACL|nr:pilus assembly protein PilM [Pseudalkalibacillus berkeleyi]MCF6138103.1 pilus assembly protein PilM [Pseudalkalibacillus berkeleyi]